jgi:preprotein translocase subunit YajC
VNDVLGAILLQAPAGGAAAPQSPFGFLFPMLLIFVIFYFLLIRPQTKRQKEHEAMLKALDKGDRIVTAGGLHGVVVGVTDEVLTVEIGGAAGGGQKLRVKVDRSRIDRLVGKGGEVE